MGINLRCGFGTSANAVIAIASWALVAGIPEDPLTISPIATESYRWGVIAGGGNFPGVAVVIMVAAVLCAPGRPP